MLLWRISLLALCRHWVNGHEVEIVLRPSAATAVTCTTVPGAASESD